jgi:hypothetical protein
VLSALRERVHRRLEDLRELPEAGLEVVQLVDVDRHLVHEPFEFGGDVRGLGGDVPADQLEGRVVADDLLPREQHPPDPAVDADRGRQVGQPHVALVPDGPLLLFELQPGEPVVTRLAQLVPRRPLPEAGAERVVALQDGLPALRLRTDRVEPLEGQEVGRGPALVENQDHARLVAEEEPLHQAPEDFFRDEGQEGSGFEGFAELFEPG